MKKAIILAGLLTVLCIVPTYASAAEQLGIYVAPKFVYGYARGIDAMVTWAEINKKNGYNETGTFDISGKDTWGGSIALGYDFNKNFDIPVRAEIEYALFSNAESKKTTVSFHPDGTTPNYRDVGKLTVGIQTLFLNSYYDFRNSSSFTPYVGAGIGMAFLDAKYREDRIYYEGEVVNSSGNTGRNLTTNFAWNMGAGVGYDFNDYLALDIGYRFVGLGRAKTRQAAVATSDSNDGVPNYIMKAKTSDIYVHQVSLGLRTTF
jgi:opacity protein-like surface antigen